MDKEKEDRVYELILDTVEDVLKWSRDCVLYSDISSGNINYIYRVQNTETGDSVIFKFADDETRVKPDGFLSPDRNTHEVTCLGWYAKCDAKFVPQVLHVDRGNHFFVMEDIKGAMTLREALMRNIRHPNIGATLVSFIVETSFPLLDVVRENKKDLQLPCWNTANDDLLKLTELLVFEDPYYNKRGKNIYTNGNEEFIKSALDNDDLLEGVEKLKTKFKTYKQTLIHGDLHTESILVRTKMDTICNKKGMDDFADLYVIDPEFAFYGPLAFDLGNIIANLFFAQAFNAYSARYGWEGQIRLEQFKEMIDGFITFFHLRAREKLVGLLEAPKCKDKDFIENYIIEILTDGMRYAGCELIRRIVGSAKVPELKVLANAKNRLLMERRLINLAVNFVLFGEGKRDPAEGFLME